MCRQETTSFLSVMSLDPITCSAMSKSSCCCMKKGTSPPTALPFLARACFWRHERGTSNRRTRSVSSIISHFSCSAFFAHRQIWLCWRTLDPSSLLHSLATLSFNTSFAFALLARNLSFWSWVKVWGSLCRTKSAATSLSFFSLLNFLTTFNLSCKKIFRRAFAGGCSHSPLSLVLYDFRSLCFLRFLCLVLPVLPSALPGWHLVKKKH